MKKTQSLRSVLGLTQDDLALILNVSRSQFSKYELGLRDIPLAAKRLLADLVAYGCAPLTDTPSPHLEAQNRQKHLAVGRMLKENEYQQELTRRKIATVESKYTEYLQALKVVDFLSVRRETQDPTDQAVLRAIAHKANKCLRSQGLDRLFRLKLKLYLLELEKMLLDAELRKFTLSPQPA
ncbi:helix-turn-helix domain-containing protein [Flavobacterium phycosphaerae]|uniref:helix-turn-helix domain-containing protein n=1 Tax=Flavobacterium phycosphaerae TaxID=2697515 RepID=UPI0013898E72|nr:helix-turn-helix transcriptional regulator [Flavobacterium phycosphaerae]